MSIKENIESKIQKTEKRLSEFSISLKRLDQEYQELLKELGLTHEQLKEHVENPSNFEVPIWEHLQNEKKMLDEKLNLELNSIVDPLKTQKSLAERGNVQQHWLFVR